MRGDSVRIDVVGNNIPFSPDFQTGWGNACLIRRAGSAVLFDTGGDGDFLLHNLRMLRVAPSRIGALVLSHEHDDHTGGLWGFLKARRKTPVFLPGSFTKAFKSKARAAGALLVEVRGPIEIRAGIFSTGEMRGAKREQALAVRTPHGLVVATGCAHPGISGMVERAVRLMKDRPYLALGGFHLRHAAGPEIDRVIARLRGVGLEKVAPNHCTGALANRMFRAEWGDGYVDTGCGATIHIGY